MQPSLKDGGSQGSLGRITFRQKTLSQPSGLQLDEKDSVEETSIKWTNSCNFQQQQN